MILPIQVTFRNLPPSTQLRALVTRWVHLAARKLDTFYRHLMSCRVIVELPHHHHQHGDLYHVRINLTVPGEELVVREEPSSHSSLQHMEGARSAKHQELHVQHKKLRLAIDDAFKAAGRRLQDYARRRRRQVKTHDPLSEARVKSLFPNQGYGFLETRAGRGVYFHRNSVLNRGFNRLQIGMPVTFAEEPGDEGPQATTVKLLHRRRNRRT